MESFAKQDNFDKCLEMFISFMKETHDKTFEKHRDVCASTLSTIFQNIIGTHDQSIPQKSLQDLNVIALTNMKGSFLQKKKPRTHTTDKVEIIALSNNVRQEHGQRYVLEHQQNNKESILKIKLLKVVIPVEVVDTRSITSKECETLTHILLQVMNVTIPFTFDTSYRTANHRIHAVFKGVSDEFQVIEFPNPVNSFSLQIKRPINHGGLYLQRSPFHVVQSITRNALNSFLNVSVNSKTIHDFVAGDHICISDFAIAYSPSIIYKQVTEADVNALNLFITRASGHDIIQSDYDESLEIVCLSVSCCETTQTTIEKTHMLDVLQAHRSSSSVARVINVSLQPCCILQKWLV